jgi:hypothetical protein
MAYIRSIKPHLPKCYFCGDSHSSRECPLEKQLAPILKKKVGMAMEHYIADNFACPKCGNHTLEVIGNHTPSLDIICSTCSKMIEVKSKCLSVEKIPSDIRLNHGAYVDFQNRLNDDLDLFVIIYGVDRIKKQISIKEVLYISNDNLKNKDLIEISKCSYNNLSLISIKDKNKLDKLKIPSSTKIIDFSDLVHTYLSSM